MTTSLVPRWLDLSAKMMKCGWVTRGSLNPRRIGTWLHRFGAWCCRTQRGGTRLNGSRHIQPKGKIIDSKVPNFWSDFFLLFRVLTNSLKGLRMVKLVMSLASSWASRRFGVHRGPRVWLSLYTNVITISSWIIGFIIIVIIVYSYSLFRMFVFCQDPNAPCMEYLPTFRLNIW